MQVQLGWWRWRSDVFRKRVHTPARARSRLSSHHPILPVRVLARAACFAKRLLISSPPLAPSSPRCLPAAPCLPAPSHGSRAAVVVYHAHSAHGLSSRLDTPPEASESSTATPARDSDTLLLKTRRAPPRHPRTLRGLAWSGRSRRSLAEVELWVRREPDNDNAARGCCFPRIHTTPPRALHTPALSLSTEAWPLACRPSHQLCRHRTDHRDRRNNPAFAFASHLEDPSPHQQH
jgi:hypothetical protein